MVIPPTQIDSQQAINRTPSTSPSASHLAVFPAPSSRIAVPQHPLSLLVPVADKDLGHFLTTIINGGIMLSFQQNSRKDLQWWYEICGRLRSLV